jgi:hypothetical protein
MAMKHEGQPWERRLKVLEARSRQQETEQATRVYTANISSAVKAMQQTSPVIPGQPVEECLSVREMYRLLNERLP